MQASILTVCSRWLEEYLPALEQVDLSTDGERLGGWVIMLALEKDHP